MIVLHLTRLKSSMVVPLRLPADAREHADAFSTLDELDRMGDTRIKEVSCPEVPNIGQYIRRADLDLGDDFDKLNALAARIEEMTEKEHILFAGALDGASINDIDDVVRVSEHLGDYLLIPNVTSITELGRFVAVSGQLHNDPRFPEEALPYLDFMKVGTEYYSDHGGAFTTHGYVLLKSSAGVQQAVPEPWRNENRDEIITLLLRGPKGAYTLVLPADEEYLSDVVEHMGIDGFSEVLIDDMSFHESAVGELASYDCVSVEAANELAHCMEEMQQEDGELLKFCSVLQVEQPDTFLQVLNLARGIDNYERVSDDPEEYGKEVLRRIGADGELIDTIDGYMDFDEFGKDAMQEDGVRRTEYDLVRRLDRPFEDETPDMGMQM